MENTRLLAQNEKERSKLWKEEEILFNESIKEDDNELLK